MSNSHYWLSSSEQAVMDAAIGSASDYGYIAVTDASLDSIVERSPFAISVRDYVAIADLTDVGENYGAVHRLNLLRLNEFQKEALESDGFAFQACHPDPTGEYWGNIMLDLAKMNAGEPDHLCNPHSNARQAVLFVQHGSWGSTLAEIQAFAAKRDASTAGAGNSDGPDPVVYRDEGEEFRLSDYPPSFVQSVEAQVGDPAQSIADMGIHPSLAPHRVVMLYYNQGAVFENGLAKRAVRYCQAFPIGYVIEDVDVDENDVPSFDFYTVDGPAYLGDPEAKARWDWCVQNCKGNWRAAAEERLDRNHARMLLQVWFEAEADEHAFLASFPGGAA